MKDPVHATIMQIKDALRKTITFFQRSYGKPVDKRKFSVRRLLKDYIKTVMTRLKSYIRTA